MAAALLINDGPKVETAITAGMLSQSGLIAFNAANCVDNNTSNVAWHTDTSVAGSTLQVDLGVGVQKRLRMCRIFVLGANNGIYDVEFSDNAIAWTNAAVGLVCSVNPAAWNFIEWTDVGAHRYWRILLTNTPGAGSSLAELEFYERPQVDVATYGFTLAEAPGWLDLPARQTPSAVVIGRPGSKELALPQEASRKLTLRGTVRAATVPLARASIDALKLALMAKPLSISFADNPDRHVFVSLEGVAPGPPPSALGPFVQESLHVDATLVAYDPLSYDNSLVSALMPAAGDTGFQVPGTGPIRPLVRIVGACVNPLIRLSGTDDGFGGGTTLGTLSLTITNSGSDVLDIDMDAKTIKKNGVSVLSAISGGDFFVIEPTDPRIKPSGFFISSTSGGGSVRYRRSWR